MKQAKKVVARRASRHAPLTLTQRVERMEHILERQRIQTGTAAPRFTKLDANGKPTTGDHAAVFDLQTGLTWMAQPVDVGKNMPWKDAMAAAAGVRLFGKTDWRAPTIQELLSIVDYTRCEPAVDTDFFKGPFDWTWSSTEAKSPAGFAWFVYLNFGNSGRFDQTLDYYVRAVRSGQNLELGL